MSQTRTAFGILALLAQAIRLSAQAGRPEELLRFVEPTDVFGRLHPCQATGPTPQGSGLCVQGRGEPGGIYRVERTEGMLRPTLEQLDLCMEQGGGLGDGGRSAYQRFDLTSCLVGLRSNEGEPCTLDPN